MCLIYVYNAVFSENAEDLMNKHTPPKKRYPTKRSPHN